MTWTATAQQIAGRLRKDFPNTPEMNVHHETIYRFIYVQPRGELKKEIAAALRSGRALRQPKNHRGDTGTGRIPDMVNIKDRPDVDDVDGTRLPGHFEGDLIVGKNNGSAIGTVVERATGYLMLLHLPDGRTADKVAAALTERLVGLPESLRQSLTWDQGKEPSQHKKISVDAGINIHFADPRSPATQPSLDIEASTGSCASTSPRAPTCQSTAQPTWTTSSNRSTTAPAPAWTTLARKSS
jgi:IS30 family transposase